MFVSNKAYTANFDHWMTMDDLIHVDLVYSAFFSYIYSCLNDIKPFLFKVKPSLLLGTDYLPPPMALEARMFLKFRPT